VIMAVPVIIAMILVIVVRVVVSVVVRFGHGPMSHRPTAGSMTRACARRRAG
jgi:hypothetical protein